MPPKKEDQRVRVTKMIIRESLIELMQHNHVSKISVKKICELAGINRSTFYAHYIDQYDLLDKIQQDAILGIKDYISSTKFLEENEDSIHVVAQLLDHVKVNAPQFKVLLSEYGDSTFQKDLMLIAQESTIESLRYNSSLDSSIVQYIELFVITGALSIIRCWLQGNCADAPSDVAKLIMKLVMQGVIGFYRPTNSASVTQSMNAASSP